jgi:hypothetical protein
MRFSRGRFLAFAGASEMYLPATTPATPDALHPVSASVAGEGRLSVRIDRQRWGAPLRDEVLFVAAEGETSVRKIVALQSAGSRAADGSLALPLPELAGLRQGYVKLARREPGWRVFDRFGWQPIVS